MFVQLIPELKSKFGGKFAVFVDNASIHKSEYTWKVFLEANVPVIYNLVAFPELNPIEQVFGVLKHIYKKNRLYNLIHEKKKSPIDCRHLQLTKE